MKYLNKAHLFIPYIVQSYELQIRLFHIYLFIDSDEMEQCKRKSLMKQRAKNTLYCGAQHFEQYERVPELDLLMGTGFWQPHGRYSIGQ